MSMQQLHGTPHGSEASVLSGLASGKARPATTADNDEESDDEEAGKVDETGTVSDEE